MFRERRNVTENQHSAGLPQVDNEIIQLVIGLLEADRRWTSRELASEVGKYHETVLGILQNILEYGKIAT
ncbi:hypothetical protein TNCV_529791 [Trichonephila clavipes]|nr:hypothetical protein TNCV_529791 [Trichonephila clavipes]